MPRSRVPRLLLSSLALVTLAACGAGPHEPSGPPAELTALPRELTPAEQGIVGAANNFSFALLRTVSAAQRDTNLFISPLSASYALGMTMNGAAGATYDQMRATLGFGTMGEAEINAGYKGLTTLLRGLDPEVDLRIANSIWHRNEFVVDPAFANSSRTFFDAPVTALDFDDAASLPKINGWVSDATAGKIPTILDGLDRELVMLLINAIYFKGSWREQFDPALTRDAPFHGVAGPQVAKLMHREGKMAYLETADLQAVDLPYGNGAFTMTVVLPREGRSVETLAASLQPAQWASLTNEIQTRTVDLYLPRFKMEWKRTLNDDLQALGLRDAFEPGAANFHRLSPATDSYISFVLQKSYVDVNEEGTEAAAVTAVGISVTSAPQVATMRVDRPFLFVIRERLSGTVLFMGKMVRI